MCRCGCARERGLCRWGHGLLNTLGHADSAALGQDPMGLWPDGDIASGSCEVMCLACIRFAQAAQALLATMTMRINPIMAPGV